MNGTRIFIKSACQISCQKPLSEEWLDSPEELTSPYVRSLDPKFSDFIPPMQARRMGLLLKRATVTSMAALSKAGIETPDAIITGTALGCMESTERFLGTICREGEQMLSPTDFMQSTHNTISSLIAIRTGTKGYNCTFSHGESSFGSALLDAIVQMNLGKISNALVGCHDETTPETFTILSRAGYFSPEEDPASEISVSMVLSTDPKDSLCELSFLRIEDIGTRSERKVAKDALSAIGMEDFADASAIVSDRNYGKIFGRNLSLPAALIYAGAHIVASGLSPVTVVIGGSYSSERTVAVLTKTR